MKGICHVWSRGRHFSPSLPGNRYLNLMAPKAITGPKSRGISFGTTLWRHVQRCCVHFLHFMQIMCSGYSLLRRHKFPRTNLFNPFKKLKNDNFGFFSISCHLPYIWCLSKPFLVEINRYPPYRDRSHFLYVSLTETFWFATGANVEQIWGPKFEVNVA